MDASQPGPGPVVIDSDAATVTVTQASPKWSVVAVSKLRTAGSQPATFTAEILVCQCSKPKCGSWHPDKVYKLAQKVSRTYL
jgi:hypothetical protein